MVKYIFSISPNKKVLRIIKKEYHLIGRKQRLKSSDVIKEVDISHLETVEKEREVITRYDYFGTQEDIDIVTEDCYLSNDIYSIISKERELLDIGDGDFYFASIDMIYIVNT